MIDVRCPCGTRIEVADSEAGRQVTCPKCEASVRVPIAKPDRDPVPSREQGIQERPRRRRDADDDNDDEGRGRLPTRTSGKAIASLVLGLLSFCLPLILTLPALILAIWALVDLNKPEKRLRGSGIAIGGLVCSVMGLFINLILIALLVPAVQKVREAAQRTQTANNFKQVALAAHSYNDTMGAFPPAELTDAGGKPLLSWRVAILPYIEQQSLFQQFHQDEPWNSPNNIKLLDLMPRIYAEPGEPNGNLTRVQMFTGPHTINGKRNGPKLGIKFQEISDGSSNTIMFAEAGTPVPWTKPEDIPIADNVPIPPMHPRPTGFLVAMCDGTVRFFPRGQIDDPTLRAFIDPSDGKIVMVPD